MLCCGKSKEPFVFNVELLDGTHLTYSKSQSIKLTTKSQVLFDAVCLKLKLIEKDYFGLCYYDSQSYKHWLDLTKGFSDDGAFMKVFHNLPCILYFGVKFYAADPCTLKEEVTRYQFFLQLKKDILDSKLTCYGKRAAELSALALQSEIGDYHPSEHKRGYVSQFRFLPNQTEKFEVEVARLHATFKSLVPASAELQFLKRCRQLDLYGVEMHTVKGKPGVQSGLGISPKGIEIFENKHRINICYWARIESVDYKDVQLKIEVESRQGKMTLHKFLLSSPFQCQHLWKSIVEHHVFYRLPQNIPSATWSKKNRYSGRTEAEILQSEVERDEPEVERGSSKRYPLRVKQASDENMNDDEEANKELNEQGSNAETDWTDVLKKKGMFGNMETGNNNSVSYMTPKNERKERNRQLQSLSDTENRSRRHRSRGRSSGEESDSPSKRRIRARARHRSNIGSDVSESSHVRRRRRKYHTDTEMANTPTGNPTSKRNNNISSSHSRRTKRISREDLAAKQQLWQHIQRDVVDPSDKPLEALQDISYTEIKTEGTPYHVKHRHSKHRHSSGKRASGASANSYAQAQEDGMVPPLPIITSSNQVQQRAHQGARFKSPGKDWDTKTTTSVDTTQSNATRTKRHRSKHRSSGNEQRNSSSMLIYSQI